MVLRILGVIFLLAVLVVAVTFGRQVKKPATQTAAVTTYEACVAANYPVAQTSPRTCVTPQGQTFTENIGNAEAMKDMIQVEAPQPNDPVQSPLTVAGTARGNWYFEASFPVKLFDANNNEIAHGTAQAQGNWMTTDWVPFKTTLNFTKPSSGNTGTLVLMKDNPSGLPQNDAQLTVPVTF
jgi:hypothetical protein